MDRQLHRLAVDEERIGNTGLPGFEWVSDGAPEWRESGGRGLWR